MNNQNIGYICFKLFILFAFLLVSCQKEEYQVQKRYSVSKLVDSTSLKPFDSAGEVIFKNYLWLLGGWSPDRTNAVFNSKNGVDWNFIGNASWSPRNLAGAVVFKEQIYIIGGYGISGVLNDVWSSVDGRNWTLKIGNAPFGKRGAFGLVEFKEKLFLIGGIGEGGIHYNDVWVSDNGVDWSCIVANSEWDERGMFGCVVMKEKLFVIGGGVYDEGYVWNVKRNFNDVWESTDGKKWHLVNGNCPFTPRRFVSSTVFNNKIVLFGGYSLPKDWFNSQYYGISIPTLDQSGIDFFSWERSRFGNLSDIWLSDDGKVWHEVFNENPIIPIRHESSIFATSDKVYILGGFGLKLYNDVWILN